MFRGLLQIFLYFFTAVTVLVGIAVVWVWSNTYGYRYRIKINAELDGVEKVGSGVFSIRFQSDVLGLAHHEWRRHSWGEVPIIDFREKGALLVAFTFPFNYGRCDPAATSILAALYFAVGRMPTEYFLVALRNFRERYALKVEEYLPLVWLPSRSNRRWARAVCPHDIADMTGLDLRIKNVESR